MFIVIIEDRHTDVEVMLFREKENAVVAAVQYLSNQAELRSEDLNSYYNQPDFDTAQNHEEPWFWIREEPDDAGYLLHAKYTGEDDYLTVQEIEIQD